MNAEGSASRTKLVKTIVVDADKCNGCRACEMICGAYHAEPKYSSINPARARIRIIRDPVTDMFVPVYAGENAPAECMGRDKYIIGGKEYEECAFCRASCPSRDIFREPDSGLPLKCDMCEGEEEPLCVQYCRVDALTFETREEQALEDELVFDELDSGLEAMAKKYGLQKMINAVGRMAAARKA